jgi:hypothetical protein
LSRARARLDSLGGEHVDNAELVEAFYALIERVAHSMLFQHSEADAFAS